MSNRDLRSQLNDLANQLRDPTRLRFLVTGIALGIAYFGIYSPLSGKIDIVKRQLKEEEHREALVQDIETLRAQVELLQGRIPADTDVNEWVQYILTGVRELPVRLIKLDSEEQKRISPYEAVALHLVVLGETEHLDQLLHWLETNDRLFRIEKLQVEPICVGETVNERVMDLYFLGLKA